MRILHLLAQRPGRTGSGINLLSTLNIGAKRGHEQAVVAGIPVSDREADFGFPAGTLLYPVLFETEALPFHVVGMSDVMPYPSTRYSEMTPAMVASWKAEFERVIRDVIEQFKPDVILTHHLWILSTIALKLSGNIPVIAYAHGTGLRQLTLASRFRDEVVGGLRGVDLVLAPNRFQKEQIEKRYGLSNVLDIGNGYRSELFFRQEKPRRDVLRLIYAGKLSAAKGVMQLIHVFESVADESLELLLIGSGSGVEADEITDAVGRSDAPIELIGAVPQERLAEFFRSGDLFILPSFYEGMPLVLIEAIACGMRCVCTDLPGVREWLSRIDASLVAYVPMPKMATIDCPEQGCLATFEADLKEALRKQIQAQKNDVPIDWRKTDQFIRSKSWEAIFIRMEEEMTRLLDRGAHSS